MKIFPLGKIRFRFVLYLVLLFLLLLPTLASPLKTTFADDDLTKQLQAKQDEIAKLEAQLRETQKQEHTLKSQLDLIDGQTKVTLLKIDETTLQIEKLKREIADLSTRINRISNSLDSLSEILLKRIVQTYKYSDIGIIDQLFSSGSFADLVEKIKYVQVAQSYEKKKLYELQATKTAYNDQKQDKQQRQDEAVKLSKQLEDYKTQLTQQKATKAELLRITQNNEAIYQQKIRVAQQEQNAILSIFNGGGHEVTIGRVNKGDIIGHMISGRSACSSGTHLHFEVHQNNNLQDPNNFLSNISFKYVDNDDGRDEGSISPHGSWDWPLFPDIYISQGFGMTPYAKAGAYNGGPHTGIDMYSSSGLTIKAVRDGTLSQGGIACGGGTLNYKKIDHGDGTSSYYLHVVN